MTTRESARDRGLERAARDIQRMLGEIRGTRRAAGLSIREAALAVGMDASAFARLERGETQHPTVEQLALACASVGLQLETRAHPVGEPVRDAGQLRLLARFRAQLAAELPWATEVPMPTAGDLRALDGWTRADRLVIGIEAETRLGDLQALQRRAQLKKRDAGLDRLVLLVADTRSNRMVLEEHRELLRGSFPLDTRAILRAFRAAHAPTDDGIAIL
jgi:transcriptional regulator with XRE-family HTH domain